MGEVWGTHSIAIEWRVTCFNKFKYLRYEEELRVYFANFSIVSSFSLDGYHLHYAELPTLASHWLICIPQLAFAWRCPEVFWYSNHLLWVEDMSRQGLRDVISQMYSFLHIDWHAIARNDEIWQPGLDSLHFKTMYLYHLLYLEWCTSYC